MAMTEWMLHGPEIATCNCNYGCPCQFNSLPTNGDCRAAVGMSIDKGHYGKVRLDGLKWAGIFAWPGPIHMGHGEVQAIIDERASPEQREALLKILTGQDSEPGATYFQVFATTIFGSTLLEIDLSQIQTIKSLIWVSKLTKPYNNVL